MGAFAMDDRVDRSAALPVSEDLSATVLGLPFYRGLVRADVDRIVRALAPALMESR
jgi:dTDP-4-amino-4,6-dideoxygalactose transaminase